MREALGFKVAEKDAFWVFFTGAGFYRGLPHPGRSSLGFSGYFTRLGGSIFRPSWRRDGRAIQGLG